MQVNNVQSSPNFQAKIMIKKNGFKNIGSDIVDSTVIGANTTGLAGSSVVESTLLPLEIVAGKGLKNTISKNLDKVKERFFNIFHRNIKTSQFDADSKLYLANSRNAAAGSGVVTTGIGSYGSSIASGLDQSIHYPASGYSNIIGDAFRGLPEGHSVHAVLDPMQKSAYDVLYNEHGIGNESASVSSGLTSTIGAALQGMGSESVMKSCGKIKEQAAKKIPS